MSGTRWLKTALLSTTLLSGVGCAHAIPRATATQLSDQYDLSRGQVRRFYDGIEVAQAAAGFVGAGRLRVGSRTHRYDCSGFVSAAYDRAGIDLQGLSSAALFERAKEIGVFHRRRIPRPGDVAFFDDTYDRDGDGRLNDRLTHVAVVEKVDDDGTITLIHKGGSGVGRTQMNLRHRHVHKRDGVLLNSYLRHKTSHDRRRTRYLTGELWQGFASFWRRS